MTSIHTAASALLLLAATAMPAQGGDPALVNELQSLVNAAPAERSAATTKLVAEIRALPTGLFKLKAADSLAQISLHADPGEKEMEAVADTLHDALAGMPVNGNDGKPAPPYMELAQLVRYEHAGKALDDPHFRDAMQILEAEDRHVEETDFTLKDLSGKSYTLSQLRGKVVLVNFWATWCGPCRLEMPDIDALYTRFRAQGLVVLAISNEEEATVRATIAHIGFMAPVLLDPGALLGHRLGILGLPRTYVFNREGKVVAVGIDQSTRRQFAQMLAQAGLKPQQ